MITADTTARRKPPAPMPAEDAHAAAEEVAGGFLGAVRTAISKLPATPDLDGPAGALTEALHKIGADPTPAIVAATRAIGTFWAAPRGVAEDVRRIDAANGLPAVAAALDQATARFDRQADLDQARRTVARLDAERLQVLGDLEQAITVADVGRVLELRPRIEVELPAAMDAARLEVAELELARVEAQRGRPERRAQDAAEAEKAAQTEMEAAQQRLEQAQADLQAAALVRFTAETIVAQTAQRARELEVEVDRLREANAQSLTERLRRLAGLAPEAPTTPTTNNHTTGDAR